MYRMKECCPFALKSSSLNWLGELNLIFMWFTGVRKPSLCVVGDKILFGRYLGSFRPVKELLQKKADKTRKNCKGQKMAGKTKYHVSLIVFKQMKYLSN